MRKTYILDIDGTLLEHIPDFENILSYPSLRSLPGAKEKTAKWHCEGHYIVLITARPEGIRKHTEQQLHAAGVVYDVLLMGAGAGPRILVNDCIPGSSQKAFAVNIVRNIEGIIDVNL